MKHFPTESFPCFHKTFAKILPPPWSIQPFNWLSFLKNYTNNKQKLNIILLEIIIQLNLRYLKKSPHKLFEMGSECNVNIILEQKNILCFFKNLDFFMKVTKLYYTICHFKSAIKILRNSQKIIFLFDIIKCIVFVACS